MSTRVKNLLYLKAKGFDLGMELVQLMFARHILQRSAKVLVRGFVKFVPALA